MVNLPLPAAAAFDNVSWYLATELNYSISMHSVTALLILGTEGHNVPCMLEVAVEGPMST
jgi:hypothetical protein